MANIQEDITSNAWDLILRFLGTGSELVYNIAHEGNVFWGNAGDFTKQMLLAIINKDKEKKKAGGEEITEGADSVYTEMLKRANKGEILSSVVVPDEDVDSFQAFLNKRNLTFVVVDNPSDDAKFFLYMSGDAPELAKCVTLWQAERGLVTEMDVDLFFENYIEGSEVDSFGSVANIGMCEMEMFRQFAKENKLNFASVQVEQDGNMVIYNPADRYKVQKCLASALLMLEGSDGARIRQQIATRSLNYQKITTSLVDRTKDFYIVNGKDPKNYVHITADELFYYKNSKEVMSFSRENDDFMERSLRTVTGMAQPVLMSKDEFELVNEQGEPDHAAIAAAVQQKVDQLPSEVEYQELQKKQNDRLKLIEEKMALDDENQGQFWLFDSSISFSDGSSFENDNDLDEKTREDMENAKQKAEQYSFHEVSRDNRSVDSLIAEAERHADEAKRNVQTRGDVDRDERDDEEVSYDHYYDYYEEM